MSATDTFRAKAPALMRALIREFTLTDLDAAAIAGNAGHESGGFTLMQELKPTVKGSRGGYGWFQWTGPRRRDFESWCKTAKLDPKSDAANTGFLIFELKTTEKRAISAVKKANGLKAKVEAFENAYERSGVKAYAKRLQWAEIALDAYRKAGATVVPLPVPPKPAAPTEPAPEPVPVPVPPPPKPTIHKVMAIILGALAAAIAALLAKYGIGG